MPIEPIPPRFSLGPTLLQLALRAAVFALLVPVVAGCATAPAPKPITDVTHLAGTWHGWVGAREGGEGFRVDLSIDRQGRWHASVHRGPRYEGIITLVDGGLRWGLTRSSNVASLSEAGAREYLTLFQFNGSVWADLERTR